MSLIEENDTVNMFYVDGTICQGLKVLHVPCDVGDMWYFEDKEGHTIAQNPNSLNLNSIVKFKP